MPVQLERSRDYDVVHYRMKFQVDLQNKKYIGENTIRLTPLICSFRECVLDAEEMTVTSVLDDRHIPLQFEQDEKRLSVFLSSSFTYGDTLSFTVYYHGENPKSGLHFNDETADNPVSVAAVSFPDNAHHWFPCYDFPHDKATHEMFITADSAYKALSNGKLIEITENIAEGTRTFHWLQDKPHSTYLYMLAVGPYEIIRDSYRGIPISHWVYKKDLEAAQKIFEHVPLMMEFFSGQFGYPYPWAKCDHVTIPNIGGGAENTSATCLGQSLIRQERAEQVIAHELAHQWWGDLITLRTWSETWLNEGFGTYADYLYIRFLKGEAEGAVDLEEKKNRYLREAREKYIKPIVFSRYEKPGNLFDSHTYSKAAAVIHMLRFILGDDRFYRVLQSFLQKYAFQPVETRDFTKTVKEITGQNLDWFFEQWFYKPGHPVFDISYRWVAAEKKLKLRIVQVQDTTKGIPIFKTPVQIGIVANTARERKMIWLNERQEDFVFEAPEKPLMVRFDEGNYLLKEMTFTKEKAELRYQLKHDDVVGRLWAAGQLGNFHADPEAIEALKDASPSDSFRGVRKIASEALEKMHE